VRLRAPEGGGEASLSGAFLVARFLCYILKDGRAGGLGLSSLPPGDCRLIPAGLVVSVKEGPAPPRGVPAPD
jgi:hypothetical protein